jgi:hypothetical protein
MVRYLFGKAHMKKAVSTVAIPDRLPHPCGIRAPMDGFIGEPPRPCLAWPPVIPALSCPILRSSIEPLGIV